MKETILTQSGLEKIEKELEELKVYKRKEIAERIKEARSFGDISENAEYDEAKNAQAELELEIEKLENLIKFSRIIDEKDIPEDIVFIGHKIKLRNMETKKDEEYLIVGNRESNPFESKISHESPLGKALIGKKKGDVVTVHLPAGLVRYKIKNMGKHNQNQL
ncbi:MAG TPA: transcription elongation factor GreA [Clostridia bacterium]|nr:transcription elongation factor GreA [Clostridia bacterium]